MLKRRNENIDSVKKVVLGIIKCFIQQIEYANNLGEGTTEEPNFDKDNAYELLKLV